MAKVRSSWDTVSCSFCSKPQNTVKKLIAGPGAVYICNECVGLCNDIMRDEGAAIAEASPPRPSPFSLELREQGYQAQRLAMTLWNLATRLEQGDAERAVSPEPPQGLAPTD